MASGQAPRPEETRIGGWWRENLWFPLIVTIIGGATILAAGGLFEDKARISIDEDPTLLSAAPIRPQVNIGSDAAFVQEVGVTSDGELSLHSVEVSVTFLSTNDSTSHKIYGPKISSFSRSFTQVPPYTDDWESPTDYKMSLPNLNPDEGVKLTFYATQRSNILVFVRSDEDTAEEYVDYVNAD